MTLRIEVRGKYRVLRTVDPELTAITAAQRLGDKLIELVDGGCRHIAVDLSHAAIIDSSAIGAILAAHGRAAEHGGEVVVLAPRSPVMRALFCASAHRVIRIVENEEELK